MKILGKHQDGAVLPVSLFILVIVTLLVVSSARTSNTGLQIVFAQQSQLTAEMTALQRAEQVLGDSRWFLAGGGAGSFQEIVAEGEKAGASGTDEVHESLLNGLEVSVLKPRCIGSAPVLGYSTQVQFPPERAYWESTIEVVDPVTNARSVLTQGTRMRMPFDSCKVL